MSNLSSDRKRRNSIDVVVRALEAKGCNPQSSGDGWTALCPAHEDRNASLSVREGDTGTVLLKCFAGCAYKEIVAALRSHRRSVEFFHGLFGQHRISLPGG